jgi:Carboxypeptidase regulatory-like domain
VRRWVIGLVAAIGAFGISIVDLPKARAAALTLEVSPSAGLADGELVSLTVRGVTGGESIIAIMCAPPLDLAGNACDLATYQTMAPTDPSLATMYVRSTLHTLDGRTVDCSRTYGACVVAAARFTTPLEFSVVPLGFGSDDHGSVTGRVTDTEGNPVAGSLVTMTPCSFPCDVVTDDDGRYDFPVALPNENLYIEVDPPDGSFLLNEPVNAWDSPEPFVVGIDETAVHDVVLGQGGLIRFRATVWGEPAYFWNGIACSESTGECFDLTEPRALPPDEYSLHDLVFDERWLLPAPVTSAVVAAAVETPVDIVLAAARIRGTVTDERDGTPIADVGITPTCGLCSGNGTVTDADGNYEYFVPPGEVKVEVVAPSAYLGPPAETRTLHDGDDATIDFALRSATKVKVVVSGAPIVGVDVCAVEGPFCGSSFASGAGIEVTVPRPGRYDVIVDGIMPLSGSALGGVVLTDVEVGEGITQLDLTLEADTDRDGQPNSVEVGDGNGDGVADSQQLGVVTADAADGSRFTVQRRGASPTLDPFSFVLMAAARGSDRTPAVPDGVAFTHGVMTARVNKVSNTVLEVWFADDAEALWVQTAEGWERADGRFFGSTIDDNHATLRVIDGGAFDLDGVVNGRMQVSFAPGTDGVDGATIVDGPVGFVEDNDASFTVVAPPGATLRCSFDLGAFVACDDTPSFVDVADGGHVLVVQPWVGGRPGTADIRYWYAGAPPGRRASGGPTGVTSSRAVDFAMTGPQPHDTLCVLDFVEVFECGAGVTRSGLAAGPHVLLVFDGTGPDGLSDLRYWVVHRPLDPN